MELIVEPDVDGRRYPAPVETALYFVALEALTNAAKHAPDAGVRLSLSLESDGLTLRVRDDGPGMGAGDRGAGTGLVNMRDRIAAVGGTLLVDSRSGVGTTVAAVVPLAQADAAGPTARPSPGDDSSRTRADRSGPPRRVG